MARVATNFRAQTLRAAFGDLTAFAGPNSYLIETGRAQVPALIAHFDHFIIMDDVELADIGAQRHGILVAGPQAESILARLGFPISANSPPEPAEPPMRLERRILRRCPAA